jgi:hypothetical protein
MRSDIFCDPVRVSRAVVAVSKASRRNQSGCLYEEKARFSYEALGAGRRRGKRRWAVVVMI